MQLNMFDSQPSAMASMMLPDADIWFKSNWLSTTDAQQLFEQLQQELPWRQDSIKLYAKEVKIPRLQSWHGAPHCEYSYSNLRMQPLPMPLPLKRVQQQLSKLLITPFNCVLANWYRDGNDGMGMHADNEPELGVNPVIASVSLGAERKFTLKHLSSGHRTDIMLTSGSLLVMAGTTQQYYHHGLAKTRKPVGGRINLTFRYIPQL